MLLAVTLGVFPLLLLLGLATWNEIRPVPVLKAAMPAAIRQEVRQSGKKRKDKTMHSPVLATPRGIYVELKFPTEFGFNPEFPGDAGFVQVQTSADNASWLDTSPNFKAWSDGTWGNAPAGDNADCETFGSNVGIYNLNNQYLRFAKPVYEFNPEFGMYEQSWEYSGSVFTGAQPDKPKIPYGVASTLPADFKRRDGTSNSNTGDSMKIAGGEFLDGVPIETTDWTATLDGTNFTIVPPPGALGNYGLHAKQYVPGHGHMDLAIVNFTVVCMVATITASGRESGSGSGGSGSGE
jgi:hypothetical protein